jgi:hypothetical protein
VVLPWRALHERPDAASAAFLQARCARPARPLVLKVILESGELATPALIHQASGIALDAGRRLPEDQHRQDPGRHARGGAGDAASHRRHRRGATAGFKASGGIRKVADAAVYIALVRDILGAAAVTAAPALRRQRAAGRHRGRAAGRRARQHQRRRHLLKRGCRMLPARSHPHQARRRRAGWGADPAFVQGLVDGSWSEGQVAALAMAIFWRGMGRDECVALTRAMTHSGPRAALGRCRHARPGGGQAFHRRRGRQGQPGAGTHRGGLRRRGADDQRPRPGPHRRHAGQAGSPARLPDAAPTAPAAGPRGAQRRAAPSSASADIWHRPTSGCMPSAT